ncbi:MAG: hypothetical protein GKR89_34705 [Candidatus Latescibacteria bacterium]|nr:hypothetical protein [Candidatus Latescibacterota bacterium]
MNKSVVFALIRKEWQFHRGPIAGGTLLGALALALVGYGSDGTYYVGAVLLLTAIIGIGIYLVFMTTIQERKEKTLAFVMSLPLSALQYTRAKLLANALFYLLPWSLLLLGSFAVIAGTDFLPNGLIPFTAVALAELLVAYCLLLGIALVTESEGWTIFVMAVCNISLNFFLYFIAHIPSINATMSGPVAVWNSTILWILLLEVLAAVAIVSLTFFFQNRKTDFIF